MEKIYPDEPSGQINVQGIRSELEWTIIFGLNFTKIYGGHMSSTDFLRRTHVLHRFLRRTCVLHRFSLHAWADWGYRATNLKTS